MLPFYIEAFAFFMETIFIGIYLYSWGKFKSKSAHLLTGIPIAVGGALSAMLITMINAWMNTPAGFNIQAFIQSGVVSGVMPFAVFHTQSTWLEVVHVMFTAYFAGSLIIVAYACLMLLKSNEDRKRQYYKKWLAIMLPLAALFTLLSIVTGIMSISAVAHWQPEKFAALEGNINPQSNAPERIGGIPINGTLKYYIPIPGFQSLLLNGSTSGVVPGLSSYPKDTWPPLIIHLMFDMLFGAAMLVGLIVALACAMYLFKWRPFENKLVLWLLILAGVLAAFALEDGWVMEELGRQPWIIYNVMLVSQAANGTPGIPIVAVLILAFYLSVIPIVIFTVRRIFRGRPLFPEVQTK